MDGSLAAVGSFQSEGSETRYNEAHAEVGNQHKSWRLRTWEMAKDLEGCAVDWLLQGRVM